METIDETVADKAKVVPSKNDTLQEQSERIINALEGDQNIEYVTACATRLRVSLKDGNFVNKEELKSVGATAVLDVKGGIQAVYGGKAILYSQEINQLLGREE